MNIEDVHKRLQVILTQFRCPYISEEKGTYSTEVRYKIEKQSEDEVSE